MLVQIFVSSISRAGVVTRANIGVVSLVKKRVAPTVNFVGVRVLQMRGRRKERKMNKHGFSLVEVWIYILLLFGSFSVLLFVVE